MRRCGNGMLRSWEMPSCKKERLFRSCALFFFFFDGAVCCFDTELHELFVYFRD